MTKLNRYRNISNRVFSWPLNSFIYAALLRREFIMNATIEKMSAQQAAIIYELAENGQMVIDDHRAEKAARKCSAVLVFVDGRRNTHLCYGFEESETTAFSLNPLYMKEGQIHLSINSVGGTLFLSKSLDEAVSEFNEASANTPWACGHIQEIIRF